MLLNKDSAALARIQEMRRAGHARKPVLEPHDFKPANHDGLPRRITFRQKTGPVRLFYMAQGGEKNE